MMEWGSGETRAKARNLLMATETYFRSFGDLDRRLMGYVPTNHFLPKLLYFFKRQSCVLYKWAADLLRGSLWVDPIVVASA